MFGKAMRDMNTCLIQLKLSGRSEAFLTA
jgi:hypothetical protein